MDGFVTPSLAKRVKQILFDEELRNEIVDYQLRSRPPFLFLFRCPE